MGLRRKKHDGHREVSRKLAIEHTRWWPYVARYLEHLLMLYGSESTVNTQDSVLRKFVSWCEERNLSEPNLITKPIMERYQAHLFYYRKPFDGKPLAMGTQRTMLAVLQGFFKWLTRQNYLLSNPACDLQMPKQSRYLPRHILSVETVKHVLSSIDVSTPLGVRDRAMMEMFYATGLRRAELAVLTTSAVDLRRDTVLVREGKGKKDRYLPLGERAHYWVERYIDTVRPLLVVAESEDILFLADWGSPFEISYVSFHVRKLLDRAGVEVPGSCHLLRHAFATHMLDGGADVRFVQELLGHAELNTTAIYTHVSLEKLRAVHASAHPLSRRVSGDQ